MTRTLTTDVPDTAAFAGRVLADDQLLGADLAGLRVGVLAGTPRHVRVLPVVVGRAARTKLFLTRPVDVLPASTLGAAVAVVAPLARVVARAHRWRSVVEPELRRKVTPLTTAVPAVVAPDFLRAVQHPRCEVVAWPVAGVVAAGVRTGDGIEHHLDVLVTC